MSDQEKEYNIEELLKDYNLDLENLGTELSKSTEELEAQLEEVGKELENRLDKVGKLLKKSVKSTALNFYHDHKKLVDSGLKGLNSVVHDILHEVKHQINKAIKESDDPVVKKELRRLRKEIIMFSMKYNFKYAMLRIKLAVGSAGVDLKKAFSQ